ncbi:hypothetical protein Aperf_G00000055677 [Anoplocephala perfoliata]
MDFSDNKSHSNDPEEDEETSNVDELSGSNLTHSQHREVSHDIRESEEQVIQAALILHEINFDITISIEFWQFDEPDDSNYLADSDSADEQGSCVSDDGDSSIDAVEVVDNISDTSADAEMNRIYDYNLSYLTYNTVSSESEISENETEHHNPLTPTDSTASLNLFPDESENSSSDYDRVLTSTAYGIVVTFSVTLMPIYLILEQGDANFESPRDYAYPLDSDYQI